MPIHDTFTKRKRRAEKAGQEDILQHEFLPSEFRVQVAYIWRNTLGPYYDNVSPWVDKPASNYRWEAIREIVARERGVFSLSGRPHDNPSEQCAAVLLNGSTDDALEIIEMSFRYVDRVLGKRPEWERREESLAQDPDDAISELNGRLREHGIGYRFENGTLVRIDSELLHTEVTVPALRLLQTHGFEGALQEFMDAHQHFRKGETKDANVDALNALESTLKAICAQRKWRYSGTATASDLVRLVMREGLIPSELQTHFENVIKAMETGLPPIRHNFGGHGQGADIKTVEHHLAAYSLHLMASNIVLLIEAHKAKRN